VGKTTLANMVVGRRNAHRYDLESQVDRNRLQNPELVLGEETGLVILDEIQLKPDLFSVLRVLVDRKSNRMRFLILGSASPDILKNSSESLAGRIEYIELSPFDVSEVAPWDRLWLRGGFPGSYLAKKEGDSLAWRNNFIRTFLERDIPQLGVRIPSLTMRRFWTMLAHYHGRIWNASDVGRSMGLTHKPVQQYLDILTGAFVIRQLQPWHANISKRQVKSPKIYIRDSGLLHSLLGITNWEDLLGSPMAGSSWEGFVIEQILRLLQPRDAYFWSTHQGAELDLYLPVGKNRFGVEIKFQEAPRITPSMRIALEDLSLHHLWVVYPGKHTYKMDKKITAIPVEGVPNLVKNNFLSQLPLPSFAP
jgi:predicted AAA+ superfamily ATPase